MNTLAGGINVRGSNGPAYGSLTVSDYRTSGFNISRFGSEPDGSRADLRPPDAEPAPHLHDLRGPCRRYAQLDRDDLPHDRPLDRLVEPWRVPVA